MLRRGSSSRRCSCPMTEIEPLPGPAAPERLDRLRDELARRGLSGFVVPRADEHQGEYVAARSQRLALRTACLGQLRQHGVAWKIFLNEHNDRFPDRRDLKDSLPGGYKPWTTWPPSDPRAGWAARSASLASCSASWAA